VLLDITEVQFIDSSGVGSLVRLLTRAQRAGGDLKLCGLSASIRDVLRVTRLATVFDAHDSEADAISAFYQRPRRADALPRSMGDVLCVAASADVLAFVRELLRQAGYAVVTSDNVSDGLTLLRATRPRLIVRDRALWTATGPSAADAFNRIAASLPVVDLPTDFSHDEAGEAGERLLTRVRETLGPGQLPSRPEPA
jgi:CheY-like chemotaxis protein